VVFIRPAGVAADWEKTALWRSAARIPDVSVVGDEAGREARRFGGETSGQTLLYDPTGRLLFSGGTTIARGHLGDSAGLEAILALLDGRRPPRATTPVFGCSLFASAEMIRREESEQR